MYKSENKKINIFQIALIALAIFVVIFILIWLGTRSKANNSKKLFESNLNKMQEVSKKYFKSHLPEEGKNKILTLEDMEDLKLVDSSSYKEADCSITKSYSYITDKGNGHYEISTSLVCGRNKDTKTEIWDINSDNSNDDCYCTCECGMCGIEEEETVCHTDIVYEHIKNGKVICPSGYTYSNNKCVKTTTSSAEKIKDVKVVDAKKASSSQKEYTDAIKTTTPGAKYCSSGTLVNGVCESTYYTDANYVVPSWGNPTVKSYSSYQGGSSETATSKVVYVGYNAATKLYTYNYYSRKAPYYTCSSGSLSGTRCKITSTSPASTYPSTTTYSCPSGYTKEGSGSSTKCYKIITKDSYYCENKDAVLSNKKCYITSYVCPAGYSLNNQKCVKTTTDYKNPTIIDKDVIWSKETFVEGYARTGNAKYSTVCEEK